MKFNISLPNEDGQPGTKTIETISNLILIGANGAGKTRLGVKLESLNEKIYPLLRITAQKALNIPDFAEFKNLEEAEKAILFGEKRIGGLDVSNKMHNKWGSKPAIFLLDDYGRLLSLIFAKSNERDRKHTQLTKETGVYQLVPDSPIDIITKIWSEILPHRLIKFDDGKILVAKIGQADYHGKEMSDGERVILYLMGQCLCAPENSVIIIDEPEIHVHKSIVGKLWNKIEELCPNKLLIYITHDLEFAASRADAKKIWVKEYNGNDSWLWEEVPIDDELPESLVIEIIGNRKNIIFCEGEKGSYDSTIYQLVFPDYHIVPRANCQKVIEATKALRGNPSLHHTEAYGIIDSDYRDQTEIEALLRHHVYNLKVAEIENLFCIEPLIRIVAAHQELDVDLVIREVTNFIINALKEEFNVQVSSRAEKRIEFLLGAYSKESNTEKGLLDGLQTTISKIDISSIYEESRKVFQDAVDSGNLEQILFIYNRKSLQSRISPILKLAKGEYTPLIIRLLKSDKKQTIIDALKTYLPKLP